ncbi:MAG TPA: DPP IV N-terminal domain-containing protein [Candidatus Acidoferrales bacterium]|nr:DPP IV N-terminal domain-containing protein [Candidatus Acidoferrales bacterium]
MRRAAQKAAVDRHIFWTSACVLLAFFGLLGVRALAQDQRGPAEQRTDARFAMRNAPEGRMARPNYELAARFVSSNVGTLVFDTEVRPHWFELSDRFWYSYETPEGTRYWVVDPARRTRAPLFDNAKVAAQLSMLTNYPYDAQHLPIKALRLVKQDTALQFEIEVRKDSVIPNETKKAQTVDEDENIQEDKEHQQEGQQRMGQRRTDQKNDQEGQENGEGGEAKPPVRTIYFELDLATGKVTRLDGMDAPLKKPMWASVSPDDKTIVFARGYNLYMMDAENYAKAQKKPGDKTIVETQLTTDGVEKYSYARVLVDEEKEQLKKFQKGDTNQIGPRTIPISIYWSKDSKKFALVRSDERKVGDLWVIHTLANPRPTLETYSYPMAGDANAPQFELQVFDVATKQHKVIQAAAFKDQTLTVSTDRILARDREHELQQTEGERRGLGGFGAPMTAHWLADTSDKLYFVRSSRDLHRIDVCVADTNTGAVKTLIEERSNVYMDDKPLRQVDNGKELIWWSERDGWGHYYLYDGDGHLKNQITSGEYMADQILSIDPKMRAMYFTATGHESHEDPYYVHLYRVNLDGSGLKLLDAGNFDNAVSASDSGKYFIDNFSRVDTAPKSILLDDQGAVLETLETTDVTRLLEAGFKYPETFHVKAADGVTDLYGVMYKPFDFDPSRKYPIIEYVYPGPQTESVTKSFSPKNQSFALAQLGFIVIEVGNRGGSPQRDKWYDTYGYGNLRDYGLADKKAAAEELAAIHPYIDINRVGIWGHSGGGFMTAAALLQYPNFFKVGWSESGNHENNVYNKYWSEKYHGVKEVDEKNGTVKFLYNIEKNSELAKNLKGHLMLTTGDMDNNVSMANTMRLAEALIKADKRFDMFVLPGMRHSYMPDAEYIFWMRANYFCRWLLGSSETGPDVIELQNEKQATPSHKFDQ